MNNYSSSRCNQSVRRKSFQALVFLAAVMVNAAIPSPAHPQPPDSSFDVALLFNGILGADREDMLAYLSDDPRIDVVSSIDAALAFPNLSDLFTFDAVLYSSDSHAHDRGIDNDLGNLLADYVDAGGGLLLSTFAFGSNNNDIGLLGRIMSPGYSPFLNRQGQGPLSGSTLDRNASDLSHPALANVESFFAKETNGFLMVDTGASVIARYENGDALLAENATGNVLGLNALPSPGTSRGEVFLTGDYEILVVNSLIYAAVPEQSSAAVFLMGCVAFGLICRLRHGH